MADKDPAPNTPPDEVEQIVDEIAQDFNDLLPPELLEEARRFALDALAAHPLGVTLAERVRPRAVNQSAEQEVAGDDRVTEAAAAARKAGGDAG